jgi:hypothetical protein
MKARTEGEVLQFLDEEFAWRRKELSTIRAEVGSAAVGSRAVRLRAGTTLLYAHWEGFVRAAAEVYIGFVARRRLQYRQLCPGLLTLALRTRLAAFETADDASAHVAFVQFVLGDLASHARLPERGAVKTSANLNSQRFKTIVLTLGLDYAPFELKENLIDSQLLDWRNKIAHGRGLFPTEGDFEFLYQEITTLLRNFKDQIANAVALKAYLREQPSPPPGSSASEALPGPDSRQVQN